MSETYVYDKAKYHMTGTKGGAQSWERASGWALFMLRWLIERDLVSPYFYEQSEQSLVQYRKGQMSFFQLYENDWDLFFAKKCSQRRAMVLLVVILTMIRGDIYRIS